MNYSKKIKKKIDKENINIGDKITVKKGTQKYTGILMPKSNQGKKNTIVLKLDGGYNIGIKNDKSTKISKISGYEETVEENGSKEEIVKDSDKRVSILSVGGTIASKIDYRTGAVKPNASVKDLTQSLPEIFEIAAIKDENILDSLSENLRPRHWQKIAKSVKEEIDSGTDGIVITHGTDTMTYTATALSFMLKDLSVPVVITGSQRSSDRGSSDAYPNLKAAVKAATSDIAEVTICMHAESSDTICYLYPGNKTRKMHTSRRDAFKAINAKPIAQININDLNLEILRDNYNKKNKDRQTKLIDKFEQQVGLIKIYPGLDPNTFRKQLFSNKGVVIEGTGLGHLPIKEDKDNKKILKILKKYIEKNDGLVYMTSQCLYGRINMNVYETGVELQDIGVRGNFNDMLPETAWVKMGWLLGNYKKSKAIKMMDKNLRGEITERTEHQQF